MQQTRQAKCFVSMLQVFLSSMACSSPAQPQKKLWEASLSLADSELREEGAAKYSSAMAGAAASQRAKLISAPPCPEVGCPVGEGAAAWPSLACLEPLK